MCSCPPSSHLTSVSCEYRAAGFVIAKSASPTSSQFQEYASTKLAFLSAMGIFRDLSAEEFGMIDVSTSVMTVSRGKIIYSAGDCTETLFMLKRGSVHLYCLSTEGRKLIIETVAPMMFFGEMTILGQPIQGLFAEAAEECRVCVMKRADVEQLILSNPKVALRMLEEIGGRVHNAHEYMGCSAFKGIPARLATLLVRLSNNGKHSVKGITQQDLADMLGIFRETISDSLGELREQGIIDIHRKEITVRCIKGLRAVAQQERRRLAQKVLIAA